MCGISPQASLRITPAGAGKTDTTAPTVGMQWDHPRRCGENPLCLFCKTAALGSPPQVRGKLYSSPVSGTSRGITPAGAGKTCRKATQASASRDHPRRCGENALSGIINVLPIGSPPQVRGKPSINTACRYSTWITPAGAGKTFYQASWTAQSEDHPRRCGENVTMQRAVT